MQNNDFQIREAIAGDAEVITRFQLMMAKESEDLELDPRITSSGVSAVFDDPAKGTYYIAVTHGTIAGCMLVTPEWSDWRNRTVLWLQSVYVLPEYRKQGIFRKMYEKLLDRVESDPSAGGIRLYVDEQNLAAQKVYSRLGMNGDHYRVFEKMKEF